MPQGAGGKVEIKQMCMTGSGRKDYIAVCGLGQLAQPPVSRPSEKFLTEPSRKFLLTAVRLKDGTNRDEPRGTGQVGMAETGPGQDAESARGGPEDGRERAVGAPTAAADETAWRCGGGAW